MFRSMLTPYRPLVAALLLVCPTLAHALPSTRAEYVVDIQAVVAPNQPQERIVRRADTQSSFAPSLTTVTASGFGESGPNHNQYGSASGTSYAQAAPGVLRALVSTEAQAVANPATNVGAGAVATALARFTDSLTFSSAGGPSTLVVTGSLLLTGNMYSASGGTNGSGFVQAKVGGTGLSQTNANAEWVGELTRQRSAAGVYTPWTPGSPVAIPFSFSVSNGQAIEVTYWLDLYASSGASFPVCASAGGLCNVVQQGSNDAVSDYSNTLAWGPVSVTNTAGSPRAFTVTSTSGYDYSMPYVPEPGTGTLLLAGLGWLGWRGRRGAHVAGRIRR